MKKKKYNLIIDSENVDAYSELYNAKCFLSEETFGKLITLFCVKGVVVFLLTVCVHFTVFSEVLSKILYVCISSIYISSVILGTIYLSKKQVEKVKEKYPFVDSTIPNDVIRSEIEKYVYQKQVGDTFQNNYKNDVMAKEPEENCDKEDVKVDSEVHSFSEKDKLDELYDKMSELEEIIQRKENSKQKNSEDAKTFKLINKKDM